MAVQRRTLKSWNALSRSQQNRWKQAYGPQALDIYRSGAKLSLRGHATTPERPSQALAKPWLFPRYVATHEGNLNELARQRGLQEHGTGPRGESPDTRDYELAGGDYTWVEPAGTLDNIPGWRWTQAFYAADYVSWAALNEMTPMEAARRAAQLFARRSGAPAGVVLIQDEGNGYSVWFVKDSGNPWKPNKKGMKKSRRRT